MKTRRPAQPFLSKEERTTCLRLVAMKVVLISQRAQALLLIDSGMTHLEAAKKSGLSIGQVRYALIAFRKKGIGMFPQAAETKAIDIPPEGKGNTGNQTQPPKGKKKDKKKKKEKKIKIDKKKKSQKKDDKSKNKKKKKKKKK